MAPRPINDDEKPLAEPRPQESAMGLRPTHDDQKLPVAPYNPEPSRDRQGVPMGLRPTNDNENPPVASARP